VAKPPTGNSMLYYAVCGVLGADNDAPEHAVRLLRLIAGGRHNGALSENDVQMALGPLQLAGWDAAALPAELQPYGLHFRAALALW
jgi:hypothetical protein